MSINIGPPSVEELRPRITVIGVGGAGGNAIANMIDAEIEGVDFIVANTDAQALKQSIAPQRIQLGTKITQGLGAGSRPEIGRAAAEYSAEVKSRAFPAAGLFFDDPGRPTAPARRPNRDNPSRSHAGGWAGSAGRSPAAGNSTAGPVCA